MRLIVAAMQAACRVEHIQAVGDANDLAQRIAVECDAAEQQQVAVPQNRGEARE